MNRARIKVARHQCCQIKLEQGINLVDPKDVVVTLLTKWVIMANEPNRSNLHLMLRFRLEGYQPYGGGNWAPS
jgi:hypothetical protein